MSMHDDDPEPRFEHDCAACIFIGPAHGLRETADVYVCPQNGLATVVVRFSSDPPDYVSRPLALFGSFTRGFIASTLAGQVTR